MNPQRINIRYTIELEELPTEVKKLYNKADSLLNNLSLIKYSDSQILSSSTLKHVHETRLKLSKVDAVLGDIQSIINSYIEYEIAQNSDPAPADLADGEASAYSDLSALAQQMEENIAHEDAPQGA